MSTIVIKDLNCKIDEHDYRGGIGTTRPMEEGIYIDGVFVYTSAWSVYAGLRSGAFGTVVVKGI